MISLCWTDFRKTFMISATYASKSGVYHGILQVTRQHLSCKMLFGGGVAYGVSGLCDSGSLEPEMPPPLSVSSPGSTGMVPEVAL